MADRFRVEGVSHGDIVRLTGKGWETAGFNATDTYVVDDISYHRPVIHADNGEGCAFPWFIFDGAVDPYWSVTKEKE